MNVLLAMAFAGLSCFAPARAEDAAPGVRLGGAPGEFDLPHSIVMDSKGRLYVADRNNARIQVFDRDGKFLGQWRDLIIPYELWMTADDEIWVCGSSPMPWPEKGGGYLGVPPKDQIMMRLDAAGKVHQLWIFPKGEEGKEKPGEVNALHGIAADSRGGVYVGDIIGARAQKFLKRQ